MTISAELIATAILGVSLVSLGWKVTGDLRKEIHLACNKVAGEVRQEIHLVCNKVTGDLRQEIHLVRKDVTVLGDRIGSLEHRMDGLDHRMGGLEQRMARLEGWIEGRFKEELELKAKPATSS